MLKRIAVVGITLLSLSVIVATPAHASHIWITDISINGVALDSTTGATNPTITVTAGSALKVRAGFYDYCGGGCTEQWTMHFAQTGGDLTLGDLSQVPANGAGSPLYTSFDQVLSTVGTWSGYLAPIQSESCPSYAGPNGEDYYSGGCGDPSVYLPFSVNVVAACGNGTIDDGEQCDDGNPDDGDCCSSTCSWSYAFTGFLSPIDNPPVVNQSKAGQGVPVKWRLTCEDGTPVSDPASFVSVTSNGGTCESGSPSDAVEVYTGASGLQYLGDGYWQYNWKTPKTYANQCRVMSLNLNDEASRTANFQFKK